MKLKFRSGFPEPSWTLGRHYVFEILMRDGTRREAFVDKDICEPGVCNHKNPGGEKRYWRDAKTKEQIPSSSVLKWRETYNCDAARQDIDNLFGKPMSVVTKDHVGDAFKRHIEREGCSSCKEYYKTQNFHSETAVSVKE